MPTVLIVTEQKLQRLGYRLLLDSEPDLRLVGEAACGAEAVRTTIALRPDVVLMHILEFTTDSIDTVRRIARDSRLHSHVLVLAPAGLDEYAWAALRAGADALLPENTAPDVLTAAIRAVATGGSAIGPNLTRRLVDIVRRRSPSSTPPPAQRLGTLTERECQVPGALASGWSTNEIAEHPSIAPTTVKSYVGLIAPHTTRSALPRPAALAPSPQHGPWTARTCPAVRRTNSSTPVLVGAAAFPPAVPWHRSIPLLV
jgi:DNA-binding NarL/FixJ family response regulator